MSIIFAILLFSVLILLHELGHFAAAKLSGVQVNEFALFMGPAIFKKQVGETVYSLRCIPIGGYCAMEGENEDTDSPRSFQKAAWWKRLAILLAGSVMNFLTGLVIFAIVFAPAKQFIVPEIAQVEDGCTVVREDGLHVGDRFLKVNGEKVYVHANFSVLLGLKGGDTHDLTIERDGKIIEFTDYKLEKHLFPGEQTERFGFSFGVQDATFGSRIVNIWNTALDSVRTVRLSLQMLFSGQAGVKDMSGPVGMVQMMSETAQASDTAVDALLNMLYFGGFIAINLAVMNLLPIPALDGGRTFFLLLTTLIEAVTKKKINPKYEGYIHGAGMVLLLGFMAFIMFKDIFVIFKR